MTIKEAWDYESDGFHPAALIVGILIAVALFVYQWIFWTA